MKRIGVIITVLVSFMFILASCDDKSKGNSKVVVTKVKGYQPSLPPVPNIPAPTVPETYQDGSYSLYGIRKNIGKTINTQASLTAYIVKIYQKPECEEGKTCHTMMPHLFLADEQNEKLNKRMIRLVGYAQNFKEMDDARADAEAGKEPEPLPEGVFLPPVIWDWRDGHKYKIKAAFLHRSSAGFMDADGLLEYKGSECLDCPVEEE